MSTAIATVREQGLQMRYSQAHQGKGKHGG
jgi:hypothetical protein